MSGFITVLIAVIGTVGAAILYVFQKGMDRREQHRAEKQKAYQNYLASLRKVVSCEVEHKVSGSYGDKYRDALLDHDNHSDALELYASEAVRELSLGLERSLLEWRRTTSDSSSWDHVTHQYFHARNQITNAMKDDLFGGSSIWYKSFLNCLREKITVQADELSRGVDSKLHHGNQDDQ